MPALWLGLAIALVITVVVVVAHRDDNLRRGWIAAAALAVVLLALGLVDLQRASQRDTHLLAPILGAILPAAGASAMARASRRMRPWLQWPLVFVAALVLLFGGLLFGAAVAPRYLPWLTA